MRFSLVKLARRDDFGYDFYAQIINLGKHFPRPLKNRSLLQLSVSWNDYPGWPYIQITSGNTGLLGIMLWIYKFGFDLDFMSRTWNFAHLDVLEE